MPFVAVPGSAVREPKTIAALSVVVPETVRVPKSEFAPCPVVVMVPEPRIFPCTDNACDGDDVPPMPTSPPCDERVEMVMMGMPFEDVADEVLMEYALFRWFGIVDVELLFK